MHLIYAHLFYYYLNLQNLVLFLPYIEIRYLFSANIVGISHDYGGHEINSKIAFVRYRNRSRKWFALIFTYISLSDDEIIRIYGKRWDIEVFFKMNKSFLKLGKEFQCRSYDSMIAHTSIVFARYIMLSVEIATIRI